MERSNGQVFQRESHLANLHPSIADVAWIPLILVGIVIGVPSGLVSMVICFSNISSLFSHIVWAFKRRALFQGSVPLWKRDAAGLGGFLHTLSEARLIAIIGVIHR